MIYKRVINKLRKIVSPTPNVPTSLNHLHGLQSAVDYANSQSESSGTSYSDYLILYTHIKETKPKYVLECGTGKSTFVIAQAMLENQLENPNTPEFDKMKLISMEDKYEWYEKSVNILPEKFQEFVEIHHSELTSYSYSLLNGIIYKDIPDLPYDFVFIDGPDQSGGTNVTACDIDFIKIVKNSNNPVSALIDNRKHTILACTLAFGQDKVSFYPELALGYVKPVTQSDLIIADKMAIRATWFKNGLISLEKGKHINYL